MKFVVADDEMPARKELGHMLMQCMPDALIDYAENGETALLLLEKTNADAIFMDIHLGDINGMSLASVIKEKYPEIYIVFATAYENYAVKAFDLNVLDYITKPFDLKRIEQTIKKIELKKQSVSKLFDMAAGCSPEKLPITKGKNIILIDICDIVYIESDGKGVIVHTVAEKYNGNCTMNSYEKRLSSQSFYRIQKSYLINLKKLEEIVPWFNNGYCAKMKGYKEVLPIGRRQIKELRQMYLF